MPIFNNRLKLERVDTRYCKSYVSVLNRVGSVVGIMPWLGYNSDPAQPEALNQAFAEAQSGRFGTVTFADDLQRLPPVIMSTAKNAKQIQSLANSQGLSADFTEESRNGGMTSNKIFPISGPGVDTSKALVALKEHIRSAQEISMVMIPAVSDIQWKGNVYGCSGGPQYSLITVPTKEDEDRFFVPGPNNSKRNVGDNVLVCTFQPPNVQFIVLTETGPLVHSVAAENAGPYLTQYLGRFYDAVNIASAAMVDALRAYTARVSSGPSPISIPGDAGALAIAAARANLTPDAFSKVKKACDDKFVGINNYVQRNPTSLVPQEFLDDLAQVCEKPSGGYTFQDISASSGGTAWFQSLVVYNLLISTTDSKLPIGVFLHTQFNKHELLNEERVQSIIRMKVARCIHLLQSVLNLKNSKVAASASQQKASAPWQQAWKKAVLLLADPGGGGEEGFSAYAKAVYAVCQLYMIMTAAIIYSSDSVAQIPYPKTPQNTEMSVLDAVSVFLAVVGSVVANSPISNTSALAQPILKDVKASQVNTEGISQIIQGIPDDVQPILGIMRENPEVVLERELDKGKITDAEASTWQGPYQFWLSTLAFGKTFIPNTQLFQGAIDTELFPPAHGIACVEYPRKHSAQLLVADQVADGLRAAIGYAIDNHKQNQTQVKLIVSGQNFMLQLEETGVKVIKNSDTFFVAFSGQDVKAPYDSMPYLAPSSNLQPLPKIKPNGQPFIPVVPDSESKQVEELHLRLEAPSAVEVTVPSFFSSSRNVKLTQEEQALLAIATSLLKFYPVVPPNVFRQYSSNVLVSNMIAKLVSERPLQWSEVTGTGRVVNVDGTIGMVILAKGEHDAHIAPNRAPLEDSVYQQPSFDRYEYELSGSTPLSEQSRTSDNAYFNLLRPRAPREEKTLNERTRQPVEIANEIHSHPSLRVDVASLQAL